MDIREKIVEAALKLLRQQGFAALSQPRIAAEAGVRQGHLTYYFPARADLLMAVADRSCDALLAPLHERAKLGVLEPLEIADRLALAATDLGLSRIFHTLVTVSEEDVSLKPQMGRLQEDSVRDLREIFGGAGLELSAEEGLMLHALLCGTSTMCLSAGTAAARKKARGLLRGAVEMLVAKRGDSRKTRRKAAPRARKAPTKR